MTNPNQYPQPSIEASQSIQLELLALSVLTGHHEALEVELLSLGGAAISKCVENIEYLEEAA